MTPETLIPSDIKKVDDVGNRGFSRKGVTECPYRYSGGCRKEYVLTSPL